MSTISAVPVATLKGGINVDKEPIPGCMCGKYGSASYCELKRKGHCSWCGFNERVYKERIDRLRKEGLHTFKNGLKGLRLEPWETIR